MKSYILSSWGIALLLTKSSHGLAPLARPSSLATAHSTARLLRLSSSSTSSSTSDDDTSTVDSSSSNSDYTHKDIDWILRCADAQETPVEDRIRFPIPFLEHPIAQSGKVVLEAWEKANDSSDSDDDSKQKLGRFGVTVTAGPPHPAIFETIQNLIEHRSNDDEPPLEYGTAAAIIYMFIEPDYRKKGLGELALQVISWLHRQVGCGYTLLVADDNGSGKLIEWYEQHGFMRAPLLQELLGSPDGIYGTTMIAPAIDLPMPDEFKLIQEAE